MSRSYKKYAGGQWACGSDKWARNYYHKSERRQTKRLLSEQKKYRAVVWQPIKETCGLYGDVCNIDDWWVEDPSEYIINYSEDTKPHYDDSDCFNCYFQYWNKDYDCFEEPADKIITNKINYTVRMADRWSWPSDGGTYWKSDLSEIRKEFDKDVFSSFYRYRTTNIWEDYVYLRELVHNKEHRKFVVRFYYKEQTGTTNWHEKEWISDDKYKETYKQILVDKHPSKIKFENDGWYKMTFWKERSKSRFVWSDLISFLLKENRIPMSLCSSENLIDWLRAHEEEILQAWLKYLYLRK